MANELTVTKEQTARFVHDAVEMETAVFTIDRAIAECERKKNTLANSIQSSQKDIQKTQEEVNRKKQSLDETEAEIRKLREFGIPPKVGDLLDTLWISLGLGLFVFIPTFVGVGIISALIDIFSKTYDGMSIGRVFSISLIAGLIAAGIGCIIFLLIWWFENSKKAREKECNEEIQKHSDIRQKKQDELQPVQDKLDQLITQSEQSQSIIALLDSQIAELRTKRSQIKSTLTQFYNLGVIPPDYRYMDCAIMLDHIFRNDLADTMRDAIKNYEERVFRGEVIQGMDKICRMLGQLSAGMSVIGQRLNSIDSNVKMMSQDLYTFSERIAAGQAKQQKATAELLNETKMSRYATAELLNETKMSRYATEQVAASTAYLELHQRNINYKYNL